MRRGVVAGAALVLVSSVVPLVSPVGAGTALAAGAGEVPCDFDGDGFADLAVGIPGEDLRGKRGAGAVQVMYGSASGLTAHDQLWHQGRKGVKGALETGDNFGSTVACGDFDADGYADLAIGIGGEDIGTKKDAGAVQVLYGSASGLTAHDQLWHQGTRGVPGANESRDLFGSLACGDFDGDGYADLAVGIPGEDVGAVTDAGGVVVLHGSASGLTSAGAVKLRQGQDGLPSEPARYEGFGAHLAPGDVNGDGHDDLVVVVEFDADFLVPGYVDLDEASSGVHVILGGPAGLTPSGSQFFSPDALGIAAWTQIRGLTLADVDGDGRDDFVGTFSTPSTRSYEVVVLHGHRPDGLRPAALPAVDTPGQDGFWAWAPAWRPPATDFYGVGEPIATDFNGDGSVDLVLGGSHNTSIIRVILGTGTGLGASYADTSVGMEWSSMAYGRALPLSGGTRDWLVVGAFNAQVGSEPSAGAVGVLQGTPAGTAGPVIVWSQDTPGIKGSAEQGDHFGVL